MNDIEKLSFTLNAWKEYTALQSEDKRTLRKINMLIKDTLRHPYEGIGHPEPLKGSLSGYWSRHHRRKEPFDLQGAG
jgi:toxin YoeB